MDARAAKLALARKKLKDHQERMVQKQEVIELPKDLVSANTEGVSIDNSNHYIDNINQTNQNSIANEVLFNEQDVLILQAPSKEEVNITEILISSKRDLEMQVEELHKKISLSESNYNQLMNNYDACKQQISNLENYITNLNNKYFKVTQELSKKDVVINDLSNMRSTLTDENNNLVEQLDFTKTMLKSKESENATLQNHLSNVQSQLEVTQLQLQQLTDGSYLASQKTQPDEVVQNTEVLLQKINCLEQQLTLLQKEKEQTKMHYENYVVELNNQLKSVILKNEKLGQEIQSLSNRENHLIEQISGLEIRLQNHQKFIINEVKEEPENKELITLQQKYELLEAKYQDINIKYEEIFNKHKYCESKILELSQQKSNETDNLNISMSKLNADIASDKVAVQRATEQNKKLKKDLQELEEAFVKISKDKLVLTEKLEAEKFLNRELTIKLAEIDEKAKDCHTKLTAKDEEMIRLQTSYRDIKAYIDRLSSNVEVDEDQDSSKQHMDVASEVIEASEQIEIPNTADVKDKEPILTAPIKDKVKIPKEDAMLKLQDRFLKIMDEVANLSDEKHRLEHIILQLQNETETICEYVALYQQQRSLLKKKDEERSAQIKLFQSECELLKNQLEEITNILIKWTTDKVFTDESKRNDILKVLEILKNLRNSVLLDNKRSCSELKDFYPCSCCSGKLIDV